MMKPSDLANTIGKRLNAPAQVKTGTNPEHQAQIDQAWEALHPQRPTED